MNHPSYRPPNHYVPPHAVYLVDLELPLETMLMVLADHCDEDKMFNRRDLLMMALNLLYVENNVKEAVLAMQVEINAYCAYRNSLYGFEYAQQRIDQAIVNFLTEMHRVFQSYRFYAASGTLNYTFGGWHGDYTPVFVPYSHLHIYPEALSAVVGGEPIDPHPSKVFRYPFEIEKPDPYLPW